MGYKANVILGLLPTSSPPAFRDYGGQKYCVIGTTTDDPETTSSTTTTGTTTGTTAATTKSSTTLITTTSSASKTSSAPGYEPTQSSIPTNCDNFNLVASGDECGTIEMT
ncbi:hypothetical protein BJX99DRAFT_256994 [Aspergillus californicus]